MTLTTFVTDPIAWAQKKRNQWAFLLFLLLPVFGCLLFSPLALDPNSRITAAAAFIFFLIAIWSFRPNQQKRAFDPLHEPRVWVANDHLTYVREDSNSTIAFNDLKRLTIRQNQTGNVYKIEVRAAKQTIELSGLQEMDQLAAALVNHAPTTCQIRYRRNRFSVLYPWRWWLLTALFVGLFIWWQMMVYSSAWLITTPLSLYFVCYYFKSIPVREKWIFGLIIVLTSWDDGLGWVNNAGGNAAAIWQQPCSLAQRITRPGLCLRAIEDAEYLYFYGADDYLMWANESTIVQTPVNSWLGFWTPTLAHERSVIFLRPSAQDQAIVTTTYDFDLPGRRSFWIWHQNQPEPFGPFTFPDRIDERSIALAPSGLLLAVAGEAGVRLLDVATGGITSLSDAAAGRTSLTFSPDGRYLFSTNEQGEPVRWDVGQTPEVAVWPLPPDFGTAVPQFITISEDGRWLAVAYPNQIIIWDMTNQRIHQQLAAPGIDQSLVPALAFAPDGRYLAAGSHQYATDESYLYLWQLGEGDPEPPLWLGNESVQTLDFSRDGALLAVGTQHAGYVLVLDKLVNE